MNRASAKQETPTSALQKKIQSKELKIAVVGFGYIGTCIGAVLADRGFRVFGIDVRKSTVDEINKGITSINEPGLKELVHRTVSQKLLSASSDFQMISQCDAVVVTVGTPLGANFDPDTRDIVAASEAIAQHLKPEQIVVLKSTVPPRTTDTVVKPILDKVGSRYHLAFCPERLAEGRAIAEFKSLPVVVGGVDELSAELAAKFWEGVLGVETITVDSTVASELVKLSDNLWIDLNVALANEVALLSEKLGVDALQVIEASNSLPKGSKWVNILAPSVGVGGYCLTKDPWFVHHLGKTLGLDLLTPVASRTVNDRMPEYSYQLIKSEIEKAGISIPQAKVAILGVSFKNNTGDCRFTPTKPIIQKFEQSGCTLEICDPWVSDSEAQTVTTRKLCRDMMAALRGADAVVFLTGHDEFKNLTVANLKELLKPGAFIFDGRNYFTQEKIRQARAAGFSYKGVGR